MPRTVCESLIPTIYERAPTVRSASALAATGYGPASSPTAPRRYAESVDRAAERGTFHPPAWSLATAASTACCRRGVAWRSTPPEPTTWATSASGRGLLPGDGGGHAGARPPQQPCAPGPRRAPPRPRPPGGAPGRPPAGRHTPSGPRAPGGARARQPPRRLPRSSACPGLPRPCARATGARRRPWRARRPRPAARARSRRRWSRPRCPPPARRRHCLCEHLHPGQHGVRGGRLDHLGERGSLREALPADDVPQEHGADGRPCRIGAITPICGRTLSVTTNRRPVEASTSATSGAASALPATTTGAPMRPFASRDALCSSTSALPPSVPPTSSTMSGLAWRRTLRSGPDIGPAETWTTLAPALRPTR